MQEVKKCPNCGAQSQYRRSSGDIACAYCDTVLYFADEPGPKEYLPQEFYGSHSFNGTVTCYSGLRSLGTALNSR